MTKTVSIETELVPLDCASCGTTFAITRRYMTARRRDHANFWCPNGHCNIYKGESDLELAERQRREANARAVHLKDQLDAERRSNAAIRGHLTRARNRIANGVCPVKGCRRHFDNVQAHMATVHPDYKAGEVHV